MVALGGDDNSKASDRRTSRLLHLRSWLVRTRTCHRHGGPVDTIKEEVRSGIQAIARAKGTSSS